MRICSCGIGIPATVMVGGKRRNLASRKKCLACSPFRHSGVVILPIAKTKHLACVLCEKPTPIRLCRACRTKIRRHRAKTAAVRLLGGKCNRCEWSGDISAFQFHHPNSDKDFNIGDAAHKSWDLVKIEVLKCELLCARCHCIEHSSRDSLRFLAEVARYQGHHYD